MSTRGVELVGVFGRHGSVYEADREFGANTRQRSSAGPRVASFLLARRGVRVSRRGCVTGAIGRVLRRAWIISLTVSLPWCFAGSWRRLF